MVQGAAEALPADRGEVFSAHESACLDLSRRIQLHAGARLRAQRPAARIRAHHLWAMHRTFTVHAVQDVWQARDVLQTCSTKHQYCFPREDSHGRRGPTWICLPSESQVPPRRPMTSAQLRWAWRSISTAACTINSCCTHAAAS